MKNVEKLMNTTQNNTMFRFVKMNQVNDSESF